MSFRTLILAFVVLPGLFVQSVAATPAIHWRRTDAFADPSGQAVGRGISSDAVGNVYVAGTVSGSYDFGGGVLTGANGDMFIAKYSPSGAHVWSKRFHSTYSGTEYITLAVDPAGSVYITGMFRGSVNFGGSTLSASPASAYTIFVARFDTNANHLWSAKFSNGNTYYGAIIAVDGQANCYLAGSFGGTVNFGGANLVSAGGLDIFLVGLSMNGQHRWSRRFGTAYEYDTVSDLAIDQNANIAIVGHLNAPTSFGGSVLQDGPDNATPYVAKFDTDGVHQWSHSYVGPGWGETVVVSFDMDGNVVFAGRNQGGGLDFGGGPLSYGLYLVKLSASGTHQWSKRFPGAGSSSASASSISIDSTNRIVMSGWSPANGIDFGGGPLDNDLYLVRFLADGSHYWSTALTSASYSSTLEFSSCDRDGNVLLAGWYLGQSQPYSGIFVNPGGDDTIIAKLAADPAQPFITAVTDVPDDQGHQLKLTFRHSGHDASSAATPIVEYGAYRQLDPIAGTWEFVGTIPASAQNSYEMVVPTVTNASSSTFIVSATTTAPVTYFNSNQASGQSIDNLAPDAPLNIIYQSGTLTWDAASEPDIDFYAVYGSDTDAFASATLVDHTDLPTLDVTGSPYLYYYVTATDNSGNESAPGTAIIATGVGGTNRYALSVSNYPNPFNPRTTVKYTVPSNGAVTISIYDASGARVRTLFSGARSAGVYTAEWDGLADNRSAVGSGVYFARITHTAGTRSTKMMLLK